MRISALILGILASLLALVAAGIYYLFSATTGGARAAESLTGGTVATGVALAGFLAAGLAMGRPRLAAGMLLGCAIVGVLYTGKMDIIIAPLYAIASLLAFLGRTPQPRPALSVQAPAAPSSPPPAA